MTNSLPNQHVVRTVDDLSPDHWMAQQLPPGASLRRYAEARAISLLTRSIQDAIQEAGLSRAEVARVLGMKPTYVSRVLNGYSNMTMRTLGALFWACGLQVTRLQTDVLGTVTVTQQVDYFTVESNVGTGTWMLNTTPGWAQVDVVFDIMTSTNLVATGLYQ